MHTTRRTATTALLALVAAIAVGVAACTPANPGPTGLYLGKQADIHPVVTPKTSPITWGSAPNIDTHYGGTLYAGTAAETQDPRPALLPNGNEPLRLWVANPNDGRTGRPAILWFHGGGFAVGIDSMYGLANGTGKEYAQRGYVSISVEYRTDTTLVGTGTATQRPPSLCQWVQDNVDPTSTVWQQRRTQCQRNIEAAQADALASIRWVRAHAAQYGIDPNKIAVGGFSAGAVTAANVAYQHDQVGTYRYFTGDDLSVDGSKAQAAIGASGCARAPDLGAPSTIDAGDAPISFIQSKFDQAVPYSCAQAMVSVARSKGLVAELHSYCTEGLHADKLYDAHKDDTDTQWTTFLARELGLYTAMPPATSDPFCT